MVKALLGLQDAPRADHTADALAIAICHSAHAPLASRLAAAGVSA
jgi:Holliday junction resolvasome RuvABC endonuclease subunit